MTCAHCGTRLGSVEFTYCDHPFCCECMSALCSWFLDGGFITDPEMFADVVDMASLPSGEVRS